MTIAYVGQAGIGGANLASPQAIAYTSSAGNALIVTGYFYDSAGTTCLPASIGDSSGTNVWHVSTSNAASPPTQDISESGQAWCAFVAWCLSAAPVTSVTIARSDSGQPAADQWWRVAISEWSGIHAADSANAGTGPSSETFALPSVTLANTGDLIVAAIASPTAGSITVPAGWTTFTSQGANVAGYVMPGTTGPFTANWTAGAADIWAGAVASFKPPVPGGGGLLLALYP
jgi:hypothetical protein